MTGPHQGGAILSGDRLYRYLLERVVSDRPGTVLYIGVNPSTADATLDDQTVKKWRGFTERIGAGRFIVLNVFAYRATDVTELAAVADPVGPEQGHWWSSTMNEVDLVVPCWGSRTKVPAELRKHFDAANLLLNVSGKPLACFGLTASRDPKHPLTLGYDTALVRYDAIQG